MPRGAILEIGHWLRLQLTVSILLLLVLNRLDYFEDFLATSDRLLLFPRILLCALLGLLLQLLCRMRLWLLFMVIIFR